MALISWLLPSCAVTPAFDSADVGGRAPGQEAAEEAVPPSPVLATGIGIDLLRIPGGEFPMGSEEGGTDERPDHTVEVPDFYLSATEVTQAQWRRVMPYNPSRYAGCGECPVERVSWHQAQDFLRRAGSLTGVSLRLPTEAEWEYAAGGGRDRTRWSGTDREEDLGGYAWYADSGSEGTHPVGTKNSNALGLYDMSGNVWEWCADWYAGEYYGASPLRNPKGPAAGASRVLRGGSSSSSAERARVSARMRRAPQRGSGTFGFRVAADAPEAGGQQ